jgi:hypothetical protein
MHDAIEDPLIRAQASQLHRAGAPLPNQVFGALPVQLLNIGFQ